MWLTLGSLAPALELDRGHRVLLEHGLQLQAQVSVATTGYFGTALWADVVGTQTALANDPIGGTIGLAQYNQCVSNFSLFGSSSASVPEPTALLLLEGRWSAWFAGVDSLGVAATFAP